MIPNIHQSIDEIIRAASPAEKIIWQQIRLITGENAGIRQFYYCGAIAGNEIITYSANRLFFIHELDLGGDFNLRTSVPRVRVYNELNAINFIINDNSSIWNATSAAANYVSNTVKLKNILLSRIDTSIYDYIKIIGYRIAY